MQTETLTTPPSLQGAGFDPIRFKETTREQRDAAGASLERLRSLPDGWLGAATELLLDMTHVTSGARVFDVAAGARGQTVAAARRVGSTG